MLMFVIKVKLPDNQSQVFSTSNYTNENNRIKFIDKFGKQKDFPSDSCFIEEKTTGGGF